MDVIQSILGLARGAIEEATSNMHTAIPAVVVRIKDLGTKCVDVQPSLSIRDEDGTIEVERSIIYNVPVVMPCTKDGGITFPMSVGDTVLLVFSMRGLSNWKRESATKVSPESMNVMSPSDAIAIAGLHQFPNSPNKPSSRNNKHNTNDVVLVHNIGKENEVEIRLDRSGNVTINSPKNVIVNCNKAEVNSKDFLINTNLYKVSAQDVIYSSGSFIIGTGAYAMSATDSATSTGTISHNGNFILDGTPLNKHTHGGVQAGSSNTAPFGG